MLIKFDRVTKSLLLCGWAALFVSGLIVYSGSWSSYAMFSFASLAMLWLAFYKVFSYSYFFLSVFLFLGFWSKLTIHLIFPASYIEPVGLFSNTPAAWDEVLWIATASAIALVSVKLAWGEIQGAVKNSDTFQEAIAAPTWFVYRRKYLWLGVLVLIPLVAIINAKLGIHQIGLAPRTILAFPLNAVIAWLVNFGLVTIIATFLWWDVQLQRGSLLSVYVALLEALFSGVSMLSRGTFIFHIIPLLIAYCRNRMRFISLTIWQALLILLVAAVFFLIGLTTVDTLRDHYYRSDTENSRNVNQQNEAIREIKQQEKESLSGRHEKQIREEREMSKIAVFDTFEREQRADDEQISTAIREFRFAAQTMVKKFNGLVAELWIALPAVLNRGLSLATDRWIGLEGVMALQSYPSKSMTLLQEGLSERYADNVVPMYQHISKSIYTGMDPNQWKFGSLPGATAFLYYSGSVLIVFFGMSLLTICLLVIEFAVQRLTRNPFLTSFYGFVVANFVAQFGVVPRQIIPVMVTLACGIACVSFLQSGGRNLGRHENL